MEEKKTRPSSWRTKMCVMSKKPPLRAALLVDRYVISAAIAVADLGGDLGVPRNPPFSTALANYTRSYNG